MILLVDECLNGGGCCGFIYTPLLLLPSLEDRFQFRNVIGCVVLNVGVFRNALF